MICMALKSPHQGGHFGILVCRLDTCMDQFDILLATTNPFIEQQESFFYEVISLSLSFLFPMLYHS